MCQGQQENGCVKVSKKMDVSRSARKWMCQGQQENQGWKE
jgi:hypothetical protein